MYRYIPLIFGTHQLFYLHVSILFHSYHFMIHYLQRSLRFAGFFSSSFFYLFKQQDIKISRTNHSEVGDGTNHAQTITLEQT